MKTIRCGNCHGTHSTVAEVRECHALPKPGGELNFRAMLDTVAGPDPITERQRKFLSTLLAEREHDLAGDMPATKRDASKMIEHLLTCPVRRAAKPGADVPEGFYAVPSATGNNDLDFWRVQRPEEGRWAGYVFVERVLGGHDYIRIAPAEQRRALDAIEKAGWESAAALFGQEIGRCGRCGRTLTDEESRAFGIGPTCRARM